ncbi:DUF1186 domain-containing protein [Thiorhodococcus mannitoliphagus]|uniref:DUF1186 domain-containing protein n=1 Tax=Thiorhodococcus mannitoliphagus TaxID=329406 RepID=A0A6P1DT95_9GAMM|nr:DUF1186 domain-containing protein [Thiorhodococcus mannitoliphagus]NEX20161.1 DUF1186 domain-containing protein [Thiorhodococcus mannitoliphagus]
MTIEDIKKQLQTYERKFPTAAVRAAVEQREAMTPILLECLRETAEDPEKVANTPGAMLHMYAIFLLAQFRERAAYPMLVKLLSAPGDLCFDVIGDTVTEDLDRILAAVCGDDLDPIKETIENPEVNEYVRSACIRALVRLVAQGDLEREHVVAYFRSLFNGKLEREAYFLRGALISDCCDLYPEELLPEIERAFADDLVDTLFITMESVERAMSEGKERAIRRCSAGGRSRIRWPR